MFIPYEELGNIIYKIFGSSKIKDFLYNLKVERNLHYINKNKPTVIKHLRQKLRENKPLKVVFYVYDETKWKCQNLYNLFDNFWRKSLCNSNNFCNFAT